MKKLFTLTVTLLVLVACSSKIEPPKTISVNELYTLEVSSTLAEIPDLQPNASLQYGNKFKELYIVVLEEPKTTFQESAALSGKAATLETFEQEVLSHYTGAKNYELVDQINTEVNGLPARLLSIKAQVQGIDLFYKIGIVEGKDNYYRIISWTLAKYQEAQQQTMQEMIDSFKEI